MGIDSSPLYQKSRFLSPRKDCKMCTLRDIQKSKKEAQYKFGKHGQFLIKNLNILEYETVRMCNSILNLIPFYYYFLLKRHNL